MAQGLPNGYAKEKKKMAYVGAAGILSRCSCSIAIAPAVVAGTPSPYVTLHIRARGERAAVPGSESEEGWTVAGWSLLRHRTTKKRAVATKEKGRGDS
jgi:hypothetical protein